MPTIHFYEKPGCTNNTRQKALLAKAGYVVIVRNLLTEPWTAERLQEFFGNRPVAEWFNRASPRVKSGEIIPESQNAATALELMLQDPLLIRRPLLEAQGRKEVGFESTLIQSWLGITPDKIEPETCPRSHQNTPCASLQSSIS
jgi:nitrogenase-associated protein